MSDYETIKAQEVNFPLPTPAKTITIGTIDGTDGSFEYLVPLYTGRRWEQPDPNDPGGPTKPVEIIVSGGLVTAVNAFSLKLRFDAIHLSGNLRVSIGSASVVAPAGQDFVEIDVGSAVVVNFKLSWGNDRFAPELPLKLDRHIVGAGAITIPALPITIVYAPPMDEQKKNVATWTATTVAGTTTALTISTSSGTTNPVVAPVMIQPWLDVSEEMKYAGKLLSKSEDVYLKNVGEAFTIISGLLGTSTNTESNATTVTNEGTITITKASTAMAGTNPSGGGPGHADSLYVLINARVCWYTNGGPIKLALIGWDSEATLTADLLSEQNDRTGLSVQTRAALLALDPFVPDPSALPSSPRFVRIPSIEVSSPLSKTLTYTFTQSDLQQTVTTQVNIEDDTASMLAFANIGVPSSQKLEWRLTQSNALTTTTSRTVSRELQLFANPGEFYTVDVYVDVVFGTFAFRAVGDADQLIANSKTYAISATDGFSSDGGATLAGFVSTGSDSEDLIATITGWKPNGGSHPTFVFAKRAVQGGVAGVWFRISFVNDAANGTAWITLYQGGSPNWAASAQPTSLAFNEGPWH